MKIKCVVSVIVFLAIILALVSTPVYASKPNPDKQRRTPITVYVYCTDRAGHRYPAQVTPNGIKCP